MMTLLSKRVILMFFIVVAAATLLPAALAQETPPTAPQNITVNRNEGRPTLFWDDDANAEYYHIYISTSDYSQVLFDGWLAKVGGTSLPQITCPGGGCEYKPDINPTTGTYIVWMQSWGNGDFSTGGFEGTGWDSSDTFSYGPEKPGSPTVDLTGTTSGNVTVSWQGTEHATWYHIWLGTSGESDPPYQQSYFEWHLAETLGCEFGMTQTCALPNTLNLADGDYEVWMQVWGPGGFSTDANLNWYQAGSFTVGDGGGNNGGGSNGGGELSATEAEVIALLNADRKAMGFGCLVHDPSLWEGARRHNIDMRDNDFFDHKGSDGSNFVQRVNEAGYTGSPTGENIAVGYQNAAAVYEGWYTSQGHYNNMFKENANQIGLSLVEGGSWGKYWTMVLGRSNDVSGACD